MPPRFPSALHSAEQRQNDQSKAKKNQQQQQSNNNNNHSDGNSEETKIARAAFIEQLFPDKFGKQPPPPPPPAKQKQQQARSTSANTASKNNNNNNPSLGFVANSTTGAGPRFARHVHGVTTSLSGANNNSSSNTSQMTAKRRRRGSSPKKITWERQTVKKISPVVRIPKEEKHKFWFSEQQTETAECDVCALPVDVACIIEPEHPMNLNLLAWEDNSCSPSSSSISSFSPQQQQQQQQNKNNKNNQSNNNKAKSAVTLYIGQAPDDDPAWHPKQQQGSGPGAMIAVATLIPGVESLPLKLSLPPGVYALEARSHKNQHQQQQQQKKEETKVLIMLQTIAEAQKLV